MPHVNVLKDMKKQYEELKKAIEKNVPSKNIENGLSNGDKEAEISRLEDAIQKQVGKWFFKFLSAVWDDCKIG